MNRLLQVMLVLAASATLAAAPVKEDATRQCERVASRAACDPATGYIAGARGPCRASDLRCIEREWEARGRVVYYPDLGICGRNHEDGGTVVACPAGLGPDTGGEPGTAVQPPGGTSGGNTPISGSARRRPSTPQPPPSPPTTDEAVGFCLPLPEPRLHRSPDREGVTGMQTWLWAGHDHSIAGGGMLRGHRVVCSANPKEWTWHTGDGASYQRSYPGDTPPAHAASHTYARKGRYRQELHVRWLVETNYGSQSVTARTARDYPVVEVRGALDE